jgi:hypothetical protein
LANTPASAPHIGSQLVVDDLPAVNLRVGRATIQAYPVPLRVRKVQLVTAWTELTQTCHMGVRLANQSETYQMIPMTEGVMRLLAQAEGVRNAGWGRVPNFNENGFNYCVGGAIAGALAGAQRNPLQFGLFKSWVIPHAEEAWPVNFGLLQGTTTSTEMGPVPAASPPRWIQTKGHRHAGSEHFDWSQAMMGISTIAHLDNATTTIEKAMIAEPSLFAPMATSELVAAAFRAYLNPLGGSF